MMSIYTLRERTVKTKTVHQVIESARRQLKQGEGICLDPLHRRRLVQSDMVTLEVYNELVNELVADSHNYA
jgi:hypothetical protein